MYLWKPNSVFLVHGHSHLGTWSLTSGSRVNSYPLWGNSYIFALADVVSKHQKIKVGDVAVLVKCLPSKRKCGFGSQHYMNYVMAHTYNPSTQEEAEPFVILGYTASWKLFCDTWDPSQNNKTRKLKSYKLAFIKCWSPHTGLTHLPMLSPTIQQTWRSFFVFLGARDGAQGVTRLKHCTTDSPTT